MPGKLRCGAAVALSVLLSAGCFVGNDGPKFKAVPAPKADLAQGNVLPVTIGVVYSTQGPGVDVFGLGGGARVAEYRLDGLDPKGTAVQLVPQDDHGTEVGSVNAVDALAGAGVLGVVYVSTGPHLMAGLQRAAVLGLPVLAPYQTMLPTSPGAATTFLTGPTTTSTAEVIAAYAGKRKLDPVVLNVGSGRPEGSERMGGKVLNLGDNESRFADVIRRFLESPAGSTVNAAVVWGDPSRSAAAVAALQRLDRVMPILLGPDAGRPLFGLRLSELQRSKQGTIDGTFVAVTPAVTDLDQTPGPQAFLAALRQAAADQALLDLGGSRPLGDKASNAVAIDTGAHDAVLLLAAASRVAKSADHRAVLEAMERLSADDVPGLAGPLPNLASRDGLPAEAVIAVQADPLGSDARRGILGDPTFGWFRVEAPGGSG